MSILPSNNEMVYQDLFLIRTITYFLSLSDSDFPLVQNALEEASVATPASPHLLHHKIATAANFLQTAKKAFSEAGYTVQTVRIATNPFGEWIGSTETITTNRLVLLDAELKDHNIDFCSLGPAKSIAEIKNICPQIVVQQGTTRFSCSAELRAGDVGTARVCAEIIQEMAQLDVLANFRFCVAASASDHIPFFPVAKSAAATTTTFLSEDDDNNVVDGAEAAAAACPKFAIGLENGRLAHALLTRCQSISNIPTMFREGMRRAIQPVQQIGQQLSNDAGEDSIEFVGIDTSLNPSLDHRDGSVAAALEQLQEVETFGGPGTLAAAAAITQALQSLPGSCGYSGLMLPLCEDRRLADLSSSLTISTLLSISQVCGVGVDTVPIPGNVPIPSLMGLLLDVAGMAERWKKSLSCRVFPISSRQAGEQTSFDSPYMVNAKILPLE